MLRIRTTAPALLLCGLLCSACAGTQTAPRADIPPSLLTCPAEPTQPQAGSDAALARWIVDLAGAGDECRAQLGRVRGLLMP